MFVTDPRIQTGDANANALLQLSLAYAARGTEQLREDMRNGIASFFMPFRWLKERLEMDGPTLLAAVNHLHQNNFFEIDVRGHGIDVWMRTKAVELDKCQSR